MSDRMRVRIEVLDPTPEGKRPVALINEHVWVITLPQKRVLMALSQVAPDAVLSPEQATEAVLGRTPDVGTADWQWLFRSTAERLRVMVNQLCPERYQGFVQCMNPGYQLVSGVSVEVRNSLLI